MLFVSVLDETYLINRLRVINSAVPFDVQVYDKEFILNVKGPIDPIKASPISEPTVVVPKNMSIHERRK